MCSSRLRTQAARRALPPAFVSSPFFLPLGGNRDTQAARPGSPSSSQHVTYAHARGFLLPFLHLWKFYLPSKAHFKYHLLQAVFLDLPLPCQLFCTVGPHSLLSTFSKSVVLEDRDWLGCWLVLPEIHPTLP